MQVREIMTPNPVAVGSSTSVALAWDLIRGFGVRHLPVVNPDGQLLGIVSDRDFGVARATPLIGDILGKISFHLEAPISTILSPAPPVTVDVDAAVEEVIELMLEHKMGAVPVVDRHGRLAGIVSYLDILRRIELVPEPGSPAAGSVERHERAGDA